MQTPSEDGGSDYFRSQNFDSYSRPRMNHTRSKSVTHPKEYYESSPSISGMSRGDQLESLYQEVDGLLEGSAPVRPHSAHAALLTPNLDNINGDGSQNERDPLQEMASLKGISKRMGGLDLDRTFLDYSPVTYDDNKPEGHGEQYASNEQHTEEGQQKAGNEAGSNRENYKSITDDSPGQQRYPSVNLAKNFEPLYDNHEADLDNMLNYRMPDFKDPETSTPTARHVAVKRTDSSTQLITPLPDQR